MRDHDLAYTPVCPAQAGIISSSEFSEIKEGIEKLEPRDLITIDTLQANGFTLTTLEENIPEGYSNINLKMVAQLWEIKSPPQSVNE